MHRLGEVESEFRNALIDCDVGQIASAWSAAVNPKGVLAIHQRNYETSLVDALLVEITRNRMADRNTVPDQSGAAFRSRAPTSGAVHRRVRRRVSGLTVKAS